MEKEVIVSIDCITYNHEKFIRKAIESFLMQETSFHYEILIHDDASTDGTQAVIREYEERYPDIIKPVYQKENQYSKGVAVEMFNLNRAKGKYIAICEGDDYWIDPHKLQKQVDYMEAHPECVMTFHAAEQVIEGRKKKLPTIRPAVGNRTFYVEEIIKRGGGFFPTNSVMHCRKELAPYPDFYLEASTKDFPLIIWAALCGEVHYLNETWSTYRVGVQGSWTYREFSSFEKRKRHHQKIDRMLDSFDAFTSFRYTEAVRHKKRKHAFILLVEEGCFQEVRKREYHDFYGEIGKKKKAVLMFKYFFPPIARWFVTMKAKTQFK